MAFAKAKKEDIVEIKPVKIERVTVRIVGDSPLIMHKWSHKAKQMMLDVQTKATKTSAREAKNPVEDLVGSLYWLTPEPTEMTQESFEEAIRNGAKFGFPVTAIKQASTAAAYRLGCIDNQAALRGSFFIDGDQNQMVEIHYGSIEPREDMVKIGMGSADIRYRGQLNDWYADLVLRINTSGKYTKEQIINFLNLGGFCCGIGEWRPEKDGQFGMFHVE